MSLPRFPARRVLSAFRGGSSLPVLVDTPSGRFVTKLRGAAQGCTALIAEIIVAELAEVLGLPVPERALIALEHDTPSDDANDELADLLRASVGDNLGLRFLPGARHLEARELDALDDAFVARLAWLDAFVMNPDRTRANPNLLLWNRQPWLIDHGAALTFHHDWAGVTEQSPRERWDPTSHLFGDRASLLEAEDSASAGAIDRDVLAAAVARVPDDFLTGAFPADDATRLRAAYTAFLWKRLRAPRPFSRQPAAA